MRNPKNPLFLDPLTTRLSVFLFIEEDSFPDGRQINFWKRILFLRSRLPRCKCSSLWTLWSCSIYLHSIESPSSVYKIFKSPRQFLISMMIREVSTTTRIGSCKTFCISIVTLRSSGSDSLAPNVCNHSTSHVDVIYCKGDQVGEIWKVERLTNISFNFIDNSQTKAYYTFKFSIFNNRFLVYL